MMRHTVRVLALLCLLAGPAGIARAENVPANPRFAEVAQKLDAGGETYVYMNAKDGMRNIVQTLRTSFAPEGADPSVIRGFDLADKMLESLGLYSIEDVGASAVRQPNGLYHCKSYARIPEGRKGVLKCLGGTPHACEALKYAPEDTVLFWSEDVDLAALLEAIQTGLQESQFQEAQGTLLVGLGQVDTALTGIAGKSLTLKGALDSLGGEITFIAGLDPLKRVQIPASPAGPLSFAYPKAVLMVRTKDATLYELAVKTLSMHDPSTTETVEGGVRKFSIPVPIPPDFPYELKPVIAQNGQYFFLATQPEYLNQILETSRGGKNLAGAAEYKELTANLPQQGNSFSFASKRFAQEVVSAVETFMKALSEIQPHQRWSAMQVSILRNLQKVPVLGSASVRVNEAGGLLVLKNSPGNDAMAAPLAGVAVAGIGAAVAVPGFIKARTTAQRNTCRENLAKMDGAKEQLALEKNLKEGAEVKWEDLIAAPDGSGGYLRKTPVCPKGGTYTLGKIGDDPTCTCGARLP